MKQAIIISALFVASISSAGARNIAWPGYDEMFATSDLVVLAQPLMRTRHTRERTTLSENIEPSVDVIGVETQFETLHVIKGRKLARFTLHHYRLAPIPAKRKGIIETVIINGPGFATYERKSWTQPFLMFLIRERDGRFAPVAGQIDMKTSVQAIFPPP